MGKLKVLLGKDKSLYYDEEVDNNSDDIETQISVINELTYDYVNEIISTSEFDEEIGFDSDIISEIANFTVNQLRKRGYRVWYPKKEDK